MTDYSLLVNTGCNLYSGIMKTLTPPLSEWLLEQIEEFLTVNDMDNDGYLFGWYAMHDKNLVPRLRDGKDISVRIFEDVLAFMQNPVTVIPRGNRKGELKPLDLKPLAIKRRTIP